MARDMLIDPAPETVAPETAGNEPCSPPSSTGDPGDETPVTSELSPAANVRVVDDSNSGEPKWTTEGGYPIYHGSVLSCRFLARPNDRWRPVLNSDGYPCGWNGTMIINPNDVDKPVFFR